MKKVHKKPLKTRNIDWIQWGNRHNFMGLMALHKFNNLNLHLSHLLNKTPSALKANIFVYRNEYLLSRMNDFIKFKERKTKFLDNFVEKFHEKVLREIKEPDILYCLADPLKPHQLDRFNLKFLEVVACNLDYAALRNKFLNRKIDLDKIYDREKAVFKKCDLIICPSDNVKAYVKKIEPSANIKIIRYPIKKHDGPIYQNNPYHNNKENINALFVGRVEKEKGIEILIKLAFEFTNINFHIIGKKYIQIDNKPKNMKFYGMLKNSDLMSFYKFADFFIFPSLSEGAAVVTQEAMSFKLPGIVSKQSSSYYEHNKTGFILDAYDYDSFSKTLKIINKDSEIFKLMKKNIGYYNKNNDIKSYNHNLHKSIFELIK